MKDSQEPRAPSQGIGVVPKGASELHLIAVLCLYSFTTKDEPGKAAPHLLTPGLVGESSESFSTPEDEGQREYQANDSDSDGPVLYTDDDDDEEDEDEDGSGESKTCFQEVGRKVSSGQKQVHFVKNKSHEPSDIWCFLSPHILFSY